MGIVNLQTDLKSLRFGHDRLGGGDSNQPYIKQPILNKPGQLSQADDDFLLRGGLKAPLDAATDVVRLTKWFFDFKSPRGLLFIAKQNLLSRTSVATQSSGNQSTTDKWKKSALNEGVYTPLSTIAQAGVGFIGGHVDKQGLIPFIKDVRTYSDVVKSSKDIDKSIVKIDNNRLVDLLKTKQIGISSDIVNILSYSGGPGSILGIGKTNIKFATNNTGAPLRTGENNIKIESTGFFPLPTPEINPIDELFQQSLLLGSETSKTFRAEGAPTPEKLSGFDVFKGKETKQKDFRLPYLKDQTTSKVTGIAPSYKPKDGKTIDGVYGSRINYTSPGQSTKNLISYTRGSGIGPIDKINAQPIYNSATPKDSLNDLINFRIGSIVPGTPTQDYIHFRAYIDSFNDSYSSQWSATKYMGRAEPFYKYGGFNRKISLSFKVAAQSKEELLEQYKKLNFLASTLAPTYSEKGYMGGSLVTLTIGGWCYELPGFIDKLTLDIPQDSPWEIGINTDGEPDPELPQLPHVIVVSGFSFQPIERFRPQKQVNNWENSTGEVNRYGHEQYIALTNNEGEPLYNKE